MNLALTLDDERKLDELSEYLDLPRVEVMKDALTILYDTLAEPTRARGKTTGRQPLLSDRP
jgi:hypothetical protein